jgi:hypothetical protein
MQCIKGEGGLKLLKYFALPWLLGGQISSFGEQLVGASRWGAGGMKEAALRANLMLEIK